MYLAKSVPLVRTLLNWYSYGCAYLSRIVFFLFKTALYYNNFKFRLLTLICDSDSVCEEQDKERDRRFLLSVKHFIMNVAAIFHRKFNNIWFLLDLFIFLLIILGYAFTPFTLACHDIMMAWQNISADLSISKRKLCRMRLRYFAKNKPIALKMFYFWTECITMQSSPLCDVLALSFNSVLHMLRLPQACKISDNFYSTKEDCFLIEFIILVYKHCILLTVARGIWNYSVGWWNCLEAIVCNIKRECSFV